MNNVCRNNQSGTEDDVPNVIYLPCDQPGCKKGIEGKILAFSALHDVILKEVSSLRLHQLVSTIQIR